MYNKNNISDNELNKASFLSEIKKENSFKTPENYFEENLQKRHSNQLKNKTLIVNITNYLIPLSVVIVFAFLVFNWNQPSPQNELSQDEILAYVYENSSLDFDEDLIFEVYYESIEQTEETNLSTDSEYIDYLIDNDIDVNAIIEN